MGTLKQSSKRLARDGSNRVQADEVAELLVRVSALLAGNQPSHEVHEQTPPAEPARFLFTVEEAAKQLGVGKTTAYSLVMSGELESVTIGRLRRIHIDSIRDYAARLVTQQSKSRNVA
jgi:excisionase family DNA binding protein